MSDAAIRDALELAFAVALAGTRLKPPVPAPPPLKPFLKFHKIPPAALGPVRKVVEADEEFRQRVGVVATEELVGRAGWLWVHRPDGWEEELVALAAEQEAAEVSAAADKAERSAVRRLEAAEQVARSAAAEAAALRVELDREREQRRAAEHQRDRLTRRADQLEIELGGARRRLSDAEAEQASAEERLAEAEERSAEAEARSAAAEERARRAQPHLAAVEPAAAGADGAPPHPDGIEEAPPVSAPNPGEGGREGRKGEDRPATLADALTEASEATSRLAAALAAASSAAAEQGVAAPPLAVDGDEAPVDRREPTRAARPRRVPLALPGGVWADSPEAALFLVRAPGVLLVVDGYNVAKLGWPELTLAEQRGRLLDALDELAARYGTDIHVVFDGADVAQLPVRRRYLRVEFSRAGVKADDVIVQLAEDLPAERPVVVATNDGEVRAGVRAGGPTSSPPSSCWAPPAAEGRVGRLRNPSHPFVRMGLGGATKEEGVMSDRIVIDCDECVMRGSAACADCVVTFVCDRSPNEAVVIDVAAERALRVLASAGLVPELRHVRRVV